MKIYLLISIILILILFSSRNIENMADIVPYTNDDLKPDLTSKCCIIEKKYLPSDNSLYGGNFKYTYSPKENGECDSSMYELNNNKQLLIDGVNNWSNNNCTDKNIVLGSCRMINNECIDFVDKSYCDKIPGMVWSEKTCNNPLDFVWQDKITRKVPERDKDDGSYVMFPEQLKKF